MLATISSSSTACKSIEAIRPETVARPYICPCFIARNLKSEWVKESNEWPFAALILSLTHSFAQSLVRIHART